jgi:hypothetical protein
MTACPYALYGSQNITLQQVMTTSLSRFTTLKEILYHLPRRQGEPHSHSGLVKKNLVPTPGFNPQTVQPTASRYICAVKVYRWRRCYFILII